MCTYNAIQLKSTLQHTGTQPSAARPPRRLCYHPAVFFCHLRLIALSFPQGKIRRNFKQNYFIFNLCKIA
jgi:hypothetical protein